MKHNKISSLLPANYVLLSVFVLLLLLSGGCKKDDSLSEKKRAMTESLIGATEADSLEAYVSWLQDMGTRFMLADNRREVAASIMNKFKSFGYNNARLDSFQVERSYGGQDYLTWQYNVIARLTGDLYPDSVSVVGGHYDSILSSNEGDPFTLAPGADDNASGVAAALEIARVLKEENFTPEGSIEFVAFAAEELGLYGSWDYAEKASASDEIFKMMLNNDMIAYETETVAGNLRVNIMNYENSGGLKASADRLCSEYTSLTGFNDNALNRYSDSYMFSLYGIPAVFFHNDKSDPYYHSPDDVTDNCNFDYCCEIVNISVALLVDKNIYR